LGIGYDAGLSIFKFGCVEVAVGVDEHFCCH
jgi:hypothetical protein